MVQEKEYQGCLNAQTKFDSQEIQILSIFSVPEISIPG